MCPSHVTLPHSHTCYFGKSHKERSPVCGQRYALVIYVDCSRRKDKGFLNTCALLYIRCLVVPPVRPVHGAGPRTQRFPLYNHGSQNSLVDKRDSTMDGHAAHHTQHSVSWGLRVTSRPSQLYGCIPSFSRSISFWSTCSHHSTFGIIGLTVECPATPGAVPRSWSMTGETPR